MKKQFNLQLVSEKIIVNHKIYFEKDALNLLKNKNLIEIDVRGSVFRELHIIIAPKIGLGEYSTTFPRNSD